MMLMRLGIGISPMFHLTIISMHNRLLSTFFGVLLGMCIPLFFWTLFFEHISLFILFPIFPIVGVIIGVVLGVLGRIPPLKVWVSLLIFTLFIGASLGFSELRSQILRNRRESIATDLAQLIPELQIVELRYSSGNGFDDLPSVEAVLSLPNSNSHIRDNFDRLLLERGWNRSSGSWRKKTYNVFLHTNGTSKEGDALITISLDFLGPWFKHVNNYL